MTRTGAEPLEKMDILRKTAVIIGYVLLMLTSVMQLVFSEDKSAGDLLILLAIFTPVFAAGLINIYRPVKGRVAYPFLAAIAPVAAAAGLAGGGPLFSYPLGIAFIILWIYLGIGLSYIRSLMLNIMILLFYLLADIFYIHYPLEYRIYIIAFNIGISVLGSMSLYHLQGIQLELEKERAIAVSAVDKLEEDLHQKTAIYSSLAHEVKTPLTIIRHYFSRYRQNVTDSIELRILQDNLDKLERHIVSLLKYERMLIDTGNEAERTEEGECSISNIIGKSLALLRPYFKRKEIEIEADIEKGLSVMLTQIDSEHVLNNLLENALRYTNRGGCVRISLHAEEDEFVRLRISDNGVGIDPSSMKKIFEPYVQLDRIRSSKQGLGLGLVIVKKIIDHCGGSINIESERGKGTDIQVLLPKAGCTEETLPDELILPLNIPGGFTEPPESSGEGRVIYVVEDNDDLRSFLVEYLSKSYRVIPFENGQQALNALKHEKLPEMIISDLYMDQMDGLTMLENVREQISGRYIPFIFISADDGEQTRLTGLEKGAVDFLIKPFSPAELNLKLSTWLNLLSGSNDEQKDLLRNSEYNLSSREYQTAILLLQGYTRNMISERLFISTNTVKTHITSIYGKCMVNSKEEFFQKFKNKQLINENLS